MMGKGLQRSPVPWRTVQGSSARTIPNQARPLQRTAAAGVVRTAATAEKVLMPAADKAANVVGKVLSNKKGLLGRFKRSDRVGTKEKEKKSAHENARLAIFWKRRNDPQNQNNPAYRKMAIFYKSMEHLSKQANQSAREDSQPRKPGFDNTPQYRNDQPMKKTFLALLLAFSPALWAGTPALRAPSFTSRM